MIIDKKPSFPQVRCRRGEWRPSSPLCLPLKCRLPSDAAGGRFALDDGVLLPNEGEIDHGREVKLECERGYFLSGPERRRLFVE